MHTDVLYAIPKAAQDRVRRTHCTDSHYTVDPPVNTTDIDYLVLLKVDDVNGFFNPELALSEFLSECTAGVPGGHWEPCSQITEEGKLLYAEDPDYSTTWYSLRKGNLNIIVTNDEEWFMRAVAATELCKALNLADKEHRIRVFRVIRDGNDEYELTGLPL